MSAFYSRSILTRSIIGETLVIGAAAFLSAKVPLVTALIICGFYILVNHFTQPYFRNSRILAFLCNAPLTVGLTNLLSKYSLAGWKTAYTAFIPAYALLIMMLIGLVATTILKFIFSKAR